MMSSYVLKYSRLLATIFLVSSSLFSYCQYPAGVPTQEQIQGALSTGIDPTQLNSQKLKAYFDDKNKKLLAGEDKNKPLVPSPDVNNKDSIKRIVKDSIESNINQETYGANIFKNTAMMNVTELSTPPLDYPIGVGDHIVVALWGGGEYQEDYIVAKDGSIFPANLGKITVQGLTFESARSLIYARFKSVVPATTNVQVTLGQPRTINVNVGGEVNNPGPVTVSAFSNAFNVIGLAGGITQYGNLRDIQVKRDGRIIETVDVYKYLTSGDIGSRIYLQNNDFVLVTFVEKKVLTIGQFKRPMYYQLKKGEGIKSLILYSGGFTANAHTSSVKVIRAENEKQVIRDVNATLILKQSVNDFLLKDGDIIRANLINPGVVNKVEVKGEITYPGLYEIKKNERLFDLLKRAGGVTKGTFLTRAYVFRVGGDTASLKEDKFEINLKDLDNPYDDVNNILLEPNDIIQLFSQREFGEHQFVEIYGEIRKEGKFKKYSGMTLQDLIYLSGGLKQSAEFGRLEIYSIVDIDSAQQGLRPTQTIVKSYSISSNLELDSVGDKILIKPFDQVFVRKNPAFHLQQNVTIHGMVKYPGVYAKLTLTETLSSLIKRAGGVLNNADLSGAVLIRTPIDLNQKKAVLEEGTDTTAISLNMEIIKNSSTPVSIDLYNAINTKNSAQDIILQQNDNIYIPEINPFVSIQGRVQSPVRVTYEDNRDRLLYYIDKAGGFGIKPWRSRIYITYANGKSKRTRNLFFFHFYPKVKEGCIITVPQRQEVKSLENAVLQSITSIFPLIIVNWIIKKL